MIKLEKTSLPFPCQSDRIELNRLNQFYRSEHSIHCDIVAWVSLAGEKILLDKENSIIRVLDKDNQEVRSVGSRIGYVQNQASERLGFEYPEDLVHYSNGSESGFLICDSGNKRIVCLNPDLSLRKYLQLPDYPYKFIGIDGELVLVSDFNRDVLFLSLKYGYLGKITLTEPVNFATICRQGDDVFLFTESEELLRFRIQLKPIDELALYFDNRNIQLQILETDIETNREKIRRLIGDDAGLILSYIGRNRDNCFDTFLKTHIMDELTSLFEKEKEILETVKKDAQDYFNYYRLLPGKGDQETGNLAKESKAFSVFNGIKGRRDLFKKALAINNAIVKNPFLIEAYRDILQKRERDTVQQIHRIADRIQTEMNTLDEDACFPLITDYWFLRDEVQYLFPEAYQEKTALKFIYRLFFTQFIRDYFYNLAVLYLTANNLERFYQLAEKELVYYPDKTGILFKYVDRLIGQRNLDRAEAMMNRLTDMNKEHVNHRFYQIYKAKSQKQKAFGFLKRELELFPHKTDLVADLIRLNVEDKEKLRTLVEEMYRPNETVMDSNFVLADAFFELDDLETGERYLDRELELFPENHKALIKKMDRMVGTYAELDETSATVYFDYLVAHLKGISDEKYLAGHIELYSIVLNRLKPNPERFADILNINWKKFSPAFFRPFQVYLSFCRFQLEYIIEAELESLDADVYLSSQSCFDLAIDHYLDKGSNLIYAEQVDAGFDLIEKILSYHPGNDRVFRFLDQLASESAFKK